MSFGIRLFIRLFIAFIAATVIGTLSHEFGHYIIAKYFGYDASIHYAYTQWAKPNPNQVVNSSDGFWITLGGPLETILTGTVGFVLLFSFRKSFENVAELSFRQWCLIFISLFWLRQTANLVTRIGGYFSKGKPFRCGDETRLSSDLHLPDSTILTATAIIGAVVLTIIIFKFVPTKQRLVFIASGLVGGAAGYVLWLDLFGKYVMP